MSHHPSRREQGSLPPLVWGLLGALLVAVFVLALTVLHPVI
jgi:hypothetical protein